MIEAIYTKAPRNAQALEKRIGYHFKDRTLLQKALTHRSALYDRRLPRNKKGNQKVKGAGSNERLEFIGDRVLGLIMAEWLLERYPHEQEGDLGSRHAHLVSRTTLGKVAQKLEFSDAIHVAYHEERIGVNQTESVMADAVEAILGAMYLDGGLEPVRQLVRKVWADIITLQASPPKDSKTALQEWVLARGLPLPVYEVIQQEGPSHAPNFLIQVKAKDKEGRGEGRSKRIAESAAAADLLHQLKNIS